MTEEPHKSIYDMACDAMYKRMSEFEQEHKIGFNTMQWCYVLTLTQGLIMASQINQWERQAQEAKNESPRTDWTN